MPDNKSKKGRPDRERVDAFDRSEFRQLHKRFPSLSVQAISGAIRCAGPMRRNIVRYLQRKMC
jgi:hypothetical protein